MHSCISDIKADVWLPLTIGRGNCITVFNDKDCNGRGAWEITGTPLRYESYLARQGIVIDMSNRNSNVMRYEKARNKLKDSDPLDTYATLCQTGPVETTTGTSIPLEIKIIFHTKSFLSKEQKFSFKYKQVVTDFLCSLFL